MSATFKKISNSNNKFENWPLTNMRDMFTRKGIEITWWASLKCITYREKCHVSSKNIHWHCLAKIFSFCRCLSTRGLRHLQNFSENSGHACHVQPTASKVFSWNKLFLAIPEYDVLIFGHMNYMGVLKESTVRRTLDTYKNFRFWRVDRKHYIIAEICHVGLVSFVSRTMTHALFP